MTRGYQAATVFSAKCSISFFAILELAFYLLGCEFAAYRKTFSQERYRLVNSQAGWSADRCHAQAMDLAVIFLHRHLYRHMYFLLEYAVCAQGNCPRLAGLGAGYRTHYP